MWNEFLPISMPITAGELSSFRDMACSCLRCPLPAFAFFMPRQAGDRPDAVPAGSVNFAFIGQFAESKERDCIFTTEYSVRVSMEAVYTRLTVDRGVPEVFNSTYDVRTLLAAASRLRDGQGIDLPGPDFLRKLLMK